MTKPKPTPTTTIPVEARSYRPREGTLPHSVIHYFRRLPDEELSHRDIGQKFDVDHNSVGSILKIAVDAGFLKREGMIFSAGPHIGQLEPAAAPLLHPSLQPDVATPHKRTYSQRRPPLAIDLTALPVLKKAFSSTPSLANGRKWELLYDKLAEVDDAIDLPIEYQAALAKSIQGRNREGKGTFKVIKLNNEQCRVGRVA